jgi:hypothetical protein
MNLVGNERVSRLGIACHGSTDASDALNDPTLSQSQTFGGFALNGSRSPNWLTADNINMYSDFTHCIGEKKWR